MMMFLMLMDVYVKGAESLLSVVDRRRHGDSLTIDSSPLSSVYDTASDASHSPLSATDHLGMSACLPVSLFSSLLLSVSVCL